MVNPPIPKQRCKILIVDDEEDILCSLENRLKWKGFDVLKASDGEEGLALYKLERPHLILLDMHLPKLDGLEVLREIRELDPKARIIVMTCDATPSRAQLFMEEGADDFVAKPFDFTYLETSILAHLPD